MFKHIIAFTLLAAGCLGTHAQQPAACLPAVHVDSSDAGWQLQNLQFDALRTKLTKQMNTARRRRESTAVYEQQIRQCNAGISYLRGCDRVTVIDSVVVCKAHFLDAYGFTPEVGKLWMSKKGAGAYYETERGYRRIFAAAATDSLHTLTLYSADKDGDTFSSGTPLEGLGVSGDANYPFMMSDGITFYFAAREQDGLGNYDLYTTRLDPETGRYYKAENMGFPYNSYANDYMLVIDETLDLGWFASDRYQPVDSVCIYTFLPNASRHTIDYENTDPSALARLASLRPIRATWSDDNAAARTAAAEKLHLKRTASRRQDTARHFVINDATTYTSERDFKTDKGRQLFQRWTQQTALLTSLDSQIAALRTDYEQASAAKRQALAPEMLSIEKQQAELRTQVHELEKSIRRAEQ